MTDTPKRSTEAEDVLEFLNSLPETDKKKSTATGAGAGAGAGATSGASGASGADDDIMGFLDELEASDKKSVKKSVKKVEDKSVDAGETAPVVEKSEQPQEVEEVEEEEEEEEQDDFPDPIASISSWWSSSGSAKVNSFWNNAKDEATKFSQKAQEEATKLANQTKLDEQLKKLQLPQLDEETKKRIINAGDEMDPSKAFGFFTKNLTSVFNSIVSTDEVLKISVTHDLENYYVESLISKSFKQVMKQVQGGIAIELVTNKSKDHNKRNLNIFEGKSIDGEKLAFANLETSINEFGKKEKETVKQEGGDQDDDDQDNVRSSNLFISILPIQPYSKDKDNANEQETLLVDSSSSNAFHFLIILKDVTNGITIITKSQAFPLKWATWLDGSEETGEDNEQDEDVDPSEWVKQWVYDGLGLSFGVLAQSYVIKRMGYDK